MRDHGPGFSEAMLAHAAERFTTGDPARGDGIGLGLAIAAGQCHVLGAELGLSNDPAGRRGRDDRAAAGMSARVALIAVACGSLAAGCGTSSGLQVAEQRHDDAGREARRRPQPRVDRLDAVAFPSTKPRLGGGRRARSSPPTDGGATWTQQYQRPAPTSARSSSPTTCTAGRLRADSLLRTDRRRRHLVAGRRAGGTRADERRLHERRRGVGHRVPVGPRRRQHRSSERWCARPTAAPAGRSSSRMSPTRSASSGGELVAGAGSQGARLDRRRGDLEHPAGRGERPHHAWFSATVQCPDLAVDLGAVPGRCGRRQPGIRRLHQRRCGRRLAAGGGRPDAGRIGPGVRASRRSTRIPARSTPSPPSEAVFLGQCPACDPQRVTVLRTADGGARLERRVVNGFVPTGLAFADAGSRLDDDADRRAWRGGARRSSPRPTAAARGTRCSRRRYRTVTRPHPADTPARSIGPVYL